MYSYFTSFGQTKRTIFFQMIKSDISLISLCLYHMKEWFYISHIMKELNLEASIS